MSKIKLATNIAKSIGKRFLKRSVAPTYPPISYLKKKILKHQDHSTEKQIELSDFKINYRNPLEVIHTYEDIFVKEIYKFSAAGNNPVILDCGSNIGLSVFYFKSLYPDSSITCFEPDENNFALLKKNIDQNRLSNIILQKKAVWIDNAGVFFEAKGSEGSRISTGVDQSYIRKVETIRLAELLSEFKSIDFLKMDIEGAEYDVIMDCKPYLSKIDFMFIEYHGTAYETERLANLLHVFDSAGFGVYIKNAADLLQNPFTQQRTGDAYDVQLNIFCYKKKNV
ncbi:MAG: FkbM family methyltransferase [Chitinophagaceae bacterium]